MNFLRNIGPTEIIIIAVIVIILFGGKKLNEWAKGIGEAGKELKKAKKEFETSFDEDENPPVEPAEEKSAEKEDSGGKSESPDRKEVA